MWRHIDVQADWRILTYGRAPNAIRLVNTIKTKLNFAHEERINLYQSRLGLLLLVMENPMDFQGQSYGQIWPLMAILRMCFSVCRDEVRRTLVIASAVSLLSSVDKNFNLGHNLWTTRDRTFILHMYSLWQDLSHHTIIFYLVTLTLKFDLLFKNFNLGHHSY